MGAFVVYIIKSSLLLAMLVSLFMLFMSRETFYKLNRYLLLFVIVVSLVLPLVNVGGGAPLQGFFDAIESGFAGTATVTTTTAGPAALPVADAVPVGEVLTGSMVLDEIDLATIVGGKTSGLFSWQLAVLAVYGLVALLLVVRLLIMYAQLARIIFRGRAVDAAQYGLNGVKLRLHNGKEKPFSWFGWVVVSMDDMSEGAREVLTHEAAHVNAGHSWDIMLTDAVIIMQWFNPLAWIMKNTLKDVHEFEADEAVIKSGVNAKQYQLLIIKKAVGARLYSIANSFNHSLTKKRITMMCKEKSKKWSRAKALYILPVVAVAALSFSTVENVNAESAGKVNEFSVNAANIADENALSAPFQSAGQASAGENLKLQDVVSANNDNEAFSLDHKRKNVLVVLDGKVFEGTLDDIAPETIKALEVRSDAAVLKQYNAEDKDGVILITTKEQAKANGTTAEPVMQVVERMPEFPGGQQELMKYIAANTKYPIEAREAGLQGKIFVQFVVGRDGAISDAKVVKSNFEVLWYGEEAEMLRYKKNNARLKLEQRVAEGACEEEIATLLKEMEEYSAQYDDVVKNSTPRTGTLVADGSEIEKSLENEALRLVNSMPNWNPGICGGEAVSTKFVLPIVYRLK